MAVKATIGGSGTLFVGEDKTLRLELLDSASVPVDMTGWAITLDIRLHDTSSDPALLTKSATITGVYNVVRATNTQRAVVDLSDTETGALPARGNKYSWKRTDDGSETILAYGTFLLERATQV